MPHLRPAATAEQAARRWVALVAAIGQHRVGDRPDRYKPRRGKRRLQTYPRLK